MRGAHPFTNQRGVTQPRSSKALSSTSSRPSSTPSREDEHSRKKRKKAKKQGRVFLEFENEKTEARYVQFRYGPPGLLFPCVISYIIAIMCFMTVTFNATADVLRDTPRTWFFYNSTWFESEREFGRYFFIGVMVGLIVVPTVLLLFNTFGRHKKTPMSGQHLEIFYCFVAFIVQSLHCFFDLRYTAYCVDDKVSVLLRDPATLQPPHRCDDFVEPYIPVSTIAAFILSPRLRYLAIFVLPWLPTPFFLRTTIFHFDHLFRTSDAIWFFTSLIYIVGFVVSEHISRRQFLQHEEVKNDIAEAKRMQNTVKRLLDAMLPVSVSKRLFANQLVADCGEVSVAFSDVAGFTAWCSAQRAEDVVRMLNTMYSLFDDGLAFYSVEKIKTIGDAYWAMCGLPDPNPNHILHACGFSQYMHQCVRIMNEDNTDVGLHIRVGVHTGQVCGGLVGKQQRTYDIFGTSNEVAELMEQRAPVKGTLLSEPAYRQLKRSFGGGAKGGGKKSSGAMFSVELQDASVDTVQGKMASFVLRTFSWLPPPQQQNRGELGRKTSSMRKVATTTAATAARVKAQREQPTNHLSRAPSTTNNNDEVFVLPVAADTTANTSAQPSSSLDLVPSSRSNGGGGTTTRNATATTTRQQSASPATAPATTTATMILDVDDAVPEMQALLKQQKQGLFKATHKLHHRFDKEEVEDQFQTFMRTLFPHKLQTMSIMLGLLILVVYIVLLAEGGRSHPWYVHLLLVVDCVAIATQLFCSVRIKVHPLAGLVAYYVECNVLLFALLVANRSVVSVDLVYLIFHFAMMFPNFGYVGGGVPYLFVCVVSIFFLVVPMMVVMAVVKSIYVVHAHIPAVCLAIWVVSLRRSEMGQRQQFKNKTLTEMALEQTKAQHSKASELVARMVPSFMVDELTVWVCGPRDNMIADNFPMVGILFTRFPTLRNQFSDSSIHPLMVMHLIGQYVEMCDDVVMQHVECTKLKIIGDVQLFASGLVVRGMCETDTRQQASSDGKAQNPLVLLKKHSDACSVQSGASSNGSRGSVRSQSYLDDDDDDQEQHHQHLSSLAHLAVALSKEIETRFEGAKIAAGLHCGVATAGVIGNDRLIYDVFGDTVNVASRVMTTSGEGVWGSTKFCSKVSMVQRHGLFFGKCVERPLKGKGTMHVKSIAALPN